LFWDGPFTGLTHGPLPLAKLEPAFDFITLFQRKTRINAAPAMPPPSQACAAGLIPRRKKQKFLLLFGKKEPLVHFCAFRGMRQPPYRKTKQRNAKMTPDMSAESTSPAQIAARLDRLPSSRAVWTIILLISLGGVFEFYDLFFTAYVAPGMVKTGLFTPQSLGIFAALKGIQVAGFGTFVFSTFAGLWFGVVVFGQAADRFGRKTVFTWSLVWYIVCSAIMAFQQSGQWLNIWRLIAGVGFGVQLVTIDTYISELIPRQLRGRAFSVNQFVTFCIVPVIALLAWLLVPLQPLGLDGWRWVVLLGSVGAGVVWALRAGIPESPRWLASKGRIAEADVIVTAIERKVMREQHDTLPPPQPAAAERPGQGRLGEIFAPQYRGRTTMLSIFNAAQVVGFYGFNSWVPTLLIARGINLTHGLEYAFIIALAQPFGPLLGILFADWIERKLQIIGGLVCMAVFMAAFAFARSPAVLILLGIAFTLAANIMSYAYHGYQAELFPTRIRSRAIGFVYSWSRLAAAFSGLIVGALLTTGGVPTVALFIGGAMLVGIAAIGIFGPSTNGLGLEQLNK
jgi:MFS transporter, putative metabolite:H+ symporter